MNARPVNYTNSKHYELSPEDCEEVDRAMKALPPLTPRQLDALVDTLTQIRMRDVG